MRKLFSNQAYMLFSLALLISACKHSPEDMANPNNSGDPPPVDTIACDSTNVTYAGVVLPILQNDCFSCHSGAAPAAGLDFTDYGDVAFVAQSGQLMGAINHLPGFQPMPEGTSKLSACEIALIGKWISDTTFNPGGNNGIPCDPDTVYFQNDVLPLLMSSCGIAGCHDEQSAQKDVILTSYFHVMQSDVVKAFDPVDSKMYEKISDDDPDDRMPPPPALPLNADQRNIIYTWILQGALNNQCDQEDCDTLNVTFAGTIFPLIQNNCFGCHSGPSPNGGISLENYTAIAAAGAVAPGNQGSLLGAVSWAPGNVPMPDNGLQLSECNIAQIRTWIEAGMPQN